MLQQIDVIFSAQHKIPEFNFARSLFPRHCWYQAVTGNIPPPAGDKLHILYLILLYSDSQILVSVVRKPFYCASVVYLPRLIDYYDVTLSREKLFTSPFKNQQIRSDLLIYKEYSSDIIPSRSI